MRSLSFIKDADEKLLGHKPERVVVASNVEESRNAAVRHQINRPVNKSFCAAGMSNVKDVQGYERQSDHCRNGR
jgi:hypothetical protein